jgi:acyl-CoA thioesterase
MLLARTPVKRQALGRAAVAEEVSGGHRMALYDVVITRADGSRVAFVRGTVYRTKQPHQ